MVLGNNSKNKAGFREALKSILGEKTIVSRLQPKEILETSDLYSLTTNAEVEEAIKKNTRKLAGEIKVLVTRAVGN